jgi:hypothetical protein
VKQALHPVSYEPHQAAAAFFGFNNSISDIGLRSFLYSFHPRATSIFLGTTGLQKIGAGSALDFYKERVIDS